MNRCFITVTILMIAFCSNGQVKQVNIGEQCPDVSMNLVNYTNSTAKISDFRGKLLILDFWATWCGPCIAALPKNDSLQKAFGDKIQILPVGYEDKKKIDFFLDKMENIRHIKVPSVTDDSVLNNYFPHVEIPHCVWIDANGKVIAITGFEEITASNIQKAINVENFVLPRHGIRYRVDIEKPFFYVMNKLTDPYGNVTDSEEVSLSNLYYKSIIAPYRNGFGSFQNFDSVRLTACNMTIEGLYKLAFFNRMNTPNNGMLNFYGKGKVIWKVKDSSLLILSDKASNSLVKQNSTLSLEWNKRYTFCYDLQVPAGRGTDKKHEMMLRDLNLFFGDLYGIKGSWEKEKKKCIVLIRTSKIDKLATKGGETDRKLNPYFFSLRNNTINTLTEFLPATYMQSLKVPMIDKTGYTGLIDMELNCDMTSLEEVNKALTKYDLRFVESEADLDVIVIRQVGKNNAVLTPIGQTDIKLINAGN